MKIYPVKLKPLPIGFSLVEMSLVIATMLGLIVFIGFGFNVTRQWQRGKNASLALQAAYSAQRSYLADHPAADITAVPISAIHAYLPEGWRSIPPIMGLNGEALSIEYSVMPPVLTTGGMAYDPSGKPDDGLWDVGE
jgi:type II secretory pathway pseudopilin PulG